jgi:AcrR family transcriptional regulator
MRSTRQAKQQTRGHETRERILARAVDLFALHGFDALTMRELGDAAGLDNSSLYRHFPSKAALVDAVLDRVAGDVLACVAARIDPAQPASLEALEDICAATGLHLFDHPASARLIVHWIMSMGDAGPGFKLKVPATDANRPGGKLLAHLLDWLARGVKQGALRKHAMPEAIVWLIGAILIRPATYGHLLTSMEPSRTRAAARQAWERELRAAVRGAFAP